MTVDPAVWQDATMTVALADATDPAIVGMKAATLARLRSNGERVPDGFVIPVGAELGTMKAALASALAGLGGRPLAVRSSAVDEDGPETSHAGEYLTVLDVESTPGAVVEAAKRVVASASGHPIAVLVQPVLPAVAAGAAFSSNPVSGDDEVVVSSIAGTAADLIAGSVTGTAWVVRDGEIRLTSGDPAHEEIIGEVAALASRLADTEGRPVDIEWVYDGSAVHLVQCRPITALPVRPDLEWPNGSWQKDVTHHPAPVTPLVASMSDAEASVVERWAERAGLLIERLDQQFIGGEVYVRGVPLGGADGSSKIPPWWLVGIVARLHPAFRRRMAAARAFTATDVFTTPGRVWTQQWRPELVSAIATLRGAHLDELDDDGLRAHIDEVMEVAGRGAEMHFDLFVPYMVAMHELVLGCERLLGWDAGQTMRLLSGYSEASSEPTRHMAEIAAAVRRSPAALAAVSGADRDLIERVRSADADVAAMLDGWIDRHGFRTLRYDWSAPTLGESPALIGTLLRSQLDGGTPMRDGSTDVEAARTRLSGAELEAFDRLVEAARAVYPVREDNVQITSGSIGALLRQAFLAVGRRLADRGVIADPDDVFMLEAHEAFDAMDSPTPLFGLVRRRRLERAWVTAHPGPTALGDPPSDPPDIRALPAEGRRINGALLWAMDLEFTPVAADVDGDVVTGLPGAAGIHTGPVRIVRSERDFDRVRPGDVVVCAITNPSWSVLFGVAGAFVCDAGGPLSHTAVLAREYDIPSVLATGDATSRLEDGAPVTVDGAKGEVRPA